MRTINLLPWREQRRAQEKRWFIIMLLLGVLGAVFVVSGIHYYSVYLMHRQMERNQVVQTEINILNKQIKKIKLVKKLKSDLISRITLMQHLQSTRVVLVHLFDELSKIMPLDIYVDQLKRHKNLIFLRGYSKSNTSISSLMRRIEKNRWLQHPVLTEIKNRNGKKEFTMNEFKLSFSLKVT